VNLHLHCRKGNPYELSDGDIDDYYKTLGSRSILGFTCAAMKQIRSWFWSRGKKKLTNAAEVEQEHPWAGVAEWLRVAHSMLDEKAVELTLNTDG
jgi:hypothetical protein